MQEMRRKDRAMTWDEGMAILEQAEYGVLALNGLDGFPHAIPMSYAMADGWLFVHGAKAGYKIDCINASAACCFTVIGDTEVLPEDFATKYASCMVYGNIERVPQESRAMAFEALLRKYSPEFMAQGRAYAERADKATELFRLKIERMTAKGRK